MEKLVDTLTGKVLDDDCAACQDLAAAHAGVSGVGNGGDASSSTRRCERCKEKQPRHVVFHHLSQFVQAEYGDLRHLPLLTAKQVS